MFFQPVTYVWLAMQDNRYTAPRLQYALSFRKQPTVRDLRFLRRVPTSDRDVCPKDESDDEVQRNNNGEERDVRIHTRHHCTQASLHRSGLGYLECREGARRETIVGS